MTPLLDIKNVSKIYPSAIALSNFNITIGKGKIIGLLGPNGSGKTTLIKLICGLIQPTAGEIFLNGKKSGVDSKKAIAYLPDKEFVPNWMSIKQIIDFFADFYDNFDRVRAANMISDLKIPTSSKFKTLSKGTREKVQLIVTMSRNADIYLLDEPIAGVDPAARDYILETILKNYNRNATIIISTHLIADVEKVLDEVIFLNYGVIKAVDSVQNIRAAHEGKTIDEIFREVFRG